MHSLSECILLYKTFKFWFNGAFSSGEGGPFMVDEESTILFMVTAFSKKQKY